MFNQRILIVIITVPLLLTGCGSKKVNVDDDPSTMAPIANTFSFAPSASEQNDPITAARFKKGIETALQAKGYRRGPESESFHIAYGVQLHHDVPSNVSVGFGIGGGSGPVGVGLGGSKRLSHDENDFHIMMFDPDHDTLFWSAQATRRIDQGAAPEQKEAAVSTIAADMLDTFPKAP